jgi:hypothetical protein
MAASSQVTANPKPGCTDLSPNFPSSQLKRTVPGLPGLRGLSKADGVSEEVSGFMQDVGLSRLSNLFAEPNSLAFNPCIAYQGTPSGIKKLFGPAHTRKLRLHGATYNRMEHSATSQHGEGLTESRVEPSERRIDFSDKTTPKFLHRDKRLRAQGSGRDGTHESFRIGPDDCDAPFTKNPPNVPLIVVNRTLE